MQQGICSLSVVPMRREPADSSEMVNQMLFGESYDLLEMRKNWGRLRLHHDRYEGWVDAKQIHLLSEAEVRRQAKARLSVATDLIDIVSQEDGGSYFPVFLGSILPSLNAEQKFRLGKKAYHYAGQARRKKLNRAEMVENAWLYLHAPYLWGGRSPFGIDCSGYTQMVYRLAGHALPRDAYQQAQLGETLSFIEESEAGDLAFFDNAEGHITHVGIILDDNYILHASGKVRLDRLDQSGIFNAELRKHTHSLRVIKKIL